MIGAIIWTLALPVRFVAYLLTDAQPPKEQE